MAGAFIDRIVQFRKPQLASESDEAIDISLTRLGKLCEALADRISDPEANGMKIDAVRLRATFNDPSGAARLKAAMMVAAETNEPDTVNTLAALLAHRLQARGRGFRCGCDKQVTRFETFNFASSTHSAYRHSSFRREAF